MPIVNRIAGYAEEMKAWRRYLHQHPELGLECHETARFVVDKLKAFGITDIHTGIATSGVVAIIEGREPGPTIGLRADMDALPIDEVSGADWTSTIDGKMHACGHDGHTTMLLGAARYLAETRNFAGRVALIFQPAEEGEGGGRIMCEEGMMDRFNIAEVYGIHNAPGLPEGHIHAGAGPMMAAVDELTLMVRGKGGHGAEPHETVDPVVAAASITMALQTIVSRNVHALEQLVISVTQIHTGTASNIIPDAARVNATIRTFSPAVRDMAERRIREICEGQAASFGCIAEIDYERGYPATVNTEAEAAFAVEVAAEVVGAERTVGDARPIMASEDFAYMLEERPGAYLFLGQGDTPTCHHPAYDFNDEIAPVGSSFFARLIERRLPLQ